MLPSIPILSPDVSPVESKAGATPRIVWPTMVLGSSEYKEGDLDWFPEEDSYRMRESRGVGGAMSSVFRGAVRVARTRIWLLDEYLLDDDKSAEKLGELFYETGAWDLKIVTADTVGAKQRAEWLQGLQTDLQTTRRDMPPQIKIYLNYKRASIPEIHDRFAVVDDTLWHCGATIGGLHKSINALTFGWSARTTRAIEFFSELFVKLERDDG
jgi:hypothetical protein